MQTGRIWNGGEVPVIDDKLFLALIDELREPAGKPEGKAWATRLPTTMTILQANSIGLEVKQALPCNCDDITTFENPEMLPCNDKAFVMSNAQIGGGTGTAKVFGKIKGAGGIIATIMLKTETGIQQDSTLLDDNGEWEIKSLPAGSYSLDLDFHAIFEENNYTFDNDGKIEAITLTDSQVLEITAQVKKG